MRSITFISTAVSVVVVVALLAFDVWYTAERGRQLLTEKFGNTDILVWCGDNVTYFYPQFVCAWPTMSYFSDGHYQDAPLHYAINQKARARTIEHTSEYICSCTVQHSPLHFAGNREQAEIVRLLLYHGAPHESPSHTSFHDVAWQAGRWGSAQALILSPQGSPGCSIIRQKEASDRIFTALCCFKRLQKQLVLPCAIPKDVVYYILSFLPDDLHKAPLGAYWKRYSPEQLIDKASFGLQLQLTTSHKIGEATIGLIFKKEKLIQALTTRHVHNVQTTLRLTSTYYSPDHALTPSQLVKCRYGDRVIAQGLAQLLDPNKIENVAPKIKEEYAKLFNQHKAHHK